MKSCVSLTCLWKIWISSFFNVVLSFYFLISCLVHTDENITKGLPTSCMSALLVLQSEMYTVHHKHNTKLVKLVIAWIMFVVQCPDMACILGPGRVERGGLLYCTMSVRVLGFSRAQSMWAQTSGVTIMLQYSTRPLGQVWVHLYLNYACNCRR